MEQAARNGEQLQPAPGADHPENCGCHEAAAGENAEETICASYICLQDVLQSGSYHVKKSECPHPFTGGSRVFSDS